MTTTNQSLGLTVKFTSSNNSRSQISGLRFQDCELSDTVSLPCRYSILRSQITNLRSQASFPVVVSRGPHPFPSRTRKLSLLEPMVLRGQLCGRVGSRRDYIEISSLKFEISKPAREISRAFFFSQGLTQLMPLHVVSAHEINSADLSGRAGHQRFSAVESEDYARENRFAGSCAGAVANVSA